MWHVKPFFNVEGSSHLFECFECLHVHDFIMHDVADVATPLHAFMKNVSSKIIKMVVALSSEACIIASSANNAEQLKQTNTNTNTTI